MVGWNVATTSSYKISNLVYFTSTILFTVDDYDEHVE